MRRDFPGFIIKQFMHIRHRSVQMKFPALASIFVMLIQLLADSHQAAACSMYKITANGVTVVGNNEDSWRTDPQIWFEPASEGKFGAVYVGYSGKNGPEGGMNEYGLVFDAFTMRTKKDMPEKDPAKKDFSFDLFKSVLETCKNIEDVYNYLIQFNLHAINGSPIFNGGMFMFADKSGNYLIAEADSIVTGNDETFLLANFSVSDTKNLSEVRIPRYLRGKAYLNNNNMPSSEQEFCKGLSAAMGENRAKVGDGTLYTTIYRLEEGTVHVYFFHDFEHEIVFNLHDELSKGPHKYILSQLFPENEGFKKFIHYITPQNNQIIFYLLILLALLFAYTTVHFLKKFFQKNEINQRASSLLIAALNVMLIYFIYVLLRHEAIYYYPSPYSDPSSLLISISSYLPFLLLLIFLPILRKCLAIRKSNDWSKVSRILLYSNLASTLLLIILFTYWGFYSIN